MGLVPVNNPPTPVQEQVGPVPGGVPDCEAIKADCSIDVDSYRDHEGKKSSSNQSHHILQNAAVEDLISRPAGFAVLLADSHSGTEHQTITGRQNERRDNKKLGRGGTQPATTFGELKKQAREDLSAGLEGKRMNKKTGKPMTKAEADKAADCIVKEAEEKVKEEAEAKGGKKVTDNTPVNRPGGCFAEGTLVWMAQGEPHAIENLVDGDLVQTLEGPQRVVRVELCHHDLVELAIGDSAPLVLASFHQLGLEEGGSRRADSLRPGDSLATLRGPARVVATRRLEGVRPVYRLGFRQPAFCPVGSAGVWSLLPAAGPPLLRHESLVQSAERELCECPS
jgi:hypothetical protein